MTRPTTGHPADHIAHEISRDITRRTLVTSSLAIVCLAAQDASAQAWQGDPQPRCAGAAHRAGG